VRYPAAMITLLAACSLANLDWQECTDSAQCRDAFGFGSVCNPSGMCEDAVPPTRCERTIPEDLFENLDEHRDLVVLGSTYERTESLGDVRSFELAIQQANDNGGLGGLDGEPDLLYGFVQCSNEVDSAFDDLTEAETTPSTALFLAETLGVPAILGPSYSSTTREAYQTVDAFGTLVISPSATNPALTAEDGANHSDADPGLLWRTAPPDDGQGKAIALDMVGRGITSVGIVFEAGDYGPGLANVVNESLPTNVSVELFEYADGAARDAYVVTVGDRGFDEILFISSAKPDVRAFLSSAGALSEQYADQPLFLADAAYDLDVFDEVRGVAQDLFPNIRGSVPKTPSGPIYESFLSSYASTYSESAADSAYTAYAYDAAWLVLAGTAWARYREEDGITGFGIAKGLRRVSDGVSVPIRATEWTRMKSTFADGGQFDAEGASGPLDFDPVTEEVAGPIDIWSLTANGNEFVVECTINPAQDTAAPADCLD
jgi:branched-chain amino acid transport system substrate-binding protein